MVTRRWQPIRDWVVRFRWRLAALTALLIVLACVFVIPQWLVGWDLGAEAGSVKGVDRAKAINDVRTTLLQGIGGAAVLAGVYFAYRQLQAGRDQLQVAQQGQLTERFTRAIDQLGNKDSLEVRLGGIRALERIAHESSEDHWPIMEMLGAYVRTHASWHERQALQPDGPRSHFRNWMGGDWPEGWPAVKPSRTFKRP